MQTPTERPVHPRVCGEQQQAAGARIRIDGSSPRVRGTAKPTGERPKRIRFIPACAGNSPVIRKDCVVPSVHPRVCGEQPAEVIDKRAKRGSSPRVRGTDPAASAIASFSRFIPACAGNSRHSRSRRSGWPVHPRVCGEQTTRPAA